VTQKKEFPSAKQRRLSHLASKLADLFDLWTIVRKNKTQKLQLHHIAEAKPLGRSPRILSIVRSHKHSHAKYDLDRSSGSQLAAPCNTPSHHPYNIALHFRAGM
jgi:hypothetical protein